MRTSTLPTRRTAAWFDLSRFDEDPADQGADDQDDPDQPATGDDGDDPGDDAGDGDEGGTKKTPARGDGKDADYWKRRARQQEDRAKSNAAAAKKLAEIEAKNKTAEERLTDEKTKAEARAAKATQRAVAAEVRALAAGAEFADPTDAQLLGDLTVYVDDDGEIDTERIETDLADLLTRKPHLRKPATPAAGNGNGQTAKPKPKPDPSQGGGRDESKPADFRTASKEERDAELAAKYGYRMRS